MTIKDGRTPLEIRPVDRDYSGLTLTDNYLISANIERSFFNGADIVRCAFVEVQLNNTEFAEAKIEGTTFVDVILTGSDFVACLFTNTSFTRCDFSKGEWRDSSFRGCTFVDCDFDHTTIALCTFLGCKFNAKSQGTAEHRAIYFNVFSACIFAKRFTDRHFISRNFGTIAKGEQSALVPSGSHISIDQMCLLNNVGRLRAIDVAEVAEATCRALTGVGQRRPSSLAFFGKILRTLSDERRISATSLIFIERLITHFAAQITDQDVFTVAMATVVEIRSALFAIAAESSNAASDDEESTVRDITIRFHEHYEKHQAEILRETLAYVSGHPNRAFEVTDVREGSTIIEIAVSTLTGGVASIGTLLIAINFVLRQAEVTIQRWDKIMRAVAGRAHAKAKITKRRSQRRSNRVPAILKTGAVVPELSPVREAVTRYGRSLVEMDERAQIKIGIEVSLEQAKRR